MSQAGDRRNLQGSAQRLLHKSLRHARAAALAAALVPLASVAVAPAVAQDSGSAGPPPQAPVEVYCVDGRASVTHLWPPNHKYVSIDIEGVTTSEGDPAIITIGRICQDERVKWNGIGSGNTCPDGMGVGTDEAQVRAERNGNRKTPGDGRVYHISFTAEDETGTAACSGEITVCVPHDQGGRSDCIDGGPLYDSTACDEECPPF